MSDTYQGYVERITYHNPEDGYTIARLATEPGGEVITIVGPVATLKEGESVQVVGTWVSHARYGRQLRVEEVRSVRPGTLQGIERYLGSGLIKGVGPVSARRIVAHFGEETLAVIDTQPDRLSEVPRLGRRRARLITEAWEEQRQIKDVMVFLQSHGVTTGYAIRIFRAYGQEAIARVQANPYRLERDVYGIGFRTADRIAQSLGVASDAPERVQAGIRYLLNQASDEGHVYLPAVELMEQARQILGVSAELIPPALESLRADDGLVTEDLHYYLPPLYHAEVGAAGALRRLLRTPPAVKLDPPGELLHSGAFRLSGEQCQAVERAGRDKVMVLTGGPGTGKTTVTRQILRLFERARLRVALCSPTGRAAKRLCEATGREARTIHRLLEFMPAERRFRRGHEDRLEADALIVDEASMIDVVLMNALLRALPDTARLVIVGDVDQLPSVGPGNVLRDVIDSGAVPVVRLTEIFRQARGSGIVPNAHRINAGEMPLIDNRDTTDFFFLEEGDPEKVVSLVEDLCARRLPAHTGCDPLRDIQVIVPMYRGETGALNLNVRLQQRMNPGGQPFRHAGTEFRVGDKVMQVRNNYDKGVFNGDLGVVVGMDAERQVAQVQFDAAVEYEPHELDELVLAYAISTHRSQGSEFPVVVLPLTTQHYVMLQRNLLYTAVTRARQMIVIVGTRRALRLAID
ncbi:MAG: ATP-dependent RecD-like DNA helicase, partial [Candidatus Latescibacterota bacterium]